MASAREALMAVVRARASRRRDVTAAVDRLLEIGLKSTSSDVTDVVWALGRHGLWQRALSVLGLKGYEGDLRSESSHALNMETFNAAVHACGRNSAWEIAQRLVAEMKECSVSPNASTFTMVISALGKAGRWKDALSLFRDAQSYGQSTSYSLNAAVNASARAGHWVYALHLLFSAPTCGTEARDVVTYTACADACSRDSHWTLSLRLMDIMMEESIYPDLPCYGALVTACGRGEHWAAALDMFERARTSCNVAAGHASVMPSSASDSGRTKHQHLSLKLYGAAVDACQVGGHWRLALQLMEDMESQCLQPDKGCFKAALGAHKRAGRL